MQGSLLHCRSGRWLCFIAVLWNPLVSMVANACPDLHGGLLLGQVRS